jgi:hypothetical protein
MGYVTRAASDLAEVLAPLTSPAPHDVEVRRWCQRLTRTRDWQRLRFTERGVHLANNAVIAWLDPRNVTSRPALLEALRVVRDCARESSAALRETLTERGLYPWATGDVTAPRWWCEACDGRGVVGGGWAGTEPQDADVCDTCAREDLDATGGVTADGTTDDPPSLPALVAVAALGAERLHTIASVVTELRRVTRVDGVPTLGDRVVWRVMTREALAAHHRRHGHAEGDIAAAFSNEFAFREACAVGGAGIGQLPPWAVEAPGYRDDVRASWPALRALALDCGVHLLDADARRVVIGVEARRVVIGVEAL